MEKVTLDSQLVHVWGQRDFYWPTLTSCWVQRIWGAIWGTGSSSFFAEKAILKPAEAAHEWTLASSAGFKKTSSSGKASYALYFTKLSICIEGGGKEQIPHRYCGLICILIYLYKDHKIFDRLPFSSVAEKQRAVPYELWEQQAICLLLGGSLLLGRKVLKDSERDSVVCAIKPQTVR